MAKFYPSLTVALLAYGTIRYINKWGHPRFWDLCTGTLRRLLRLTDFDLEYVESVIKIQILI